MAKQDDRRYASREQLVMEHLTMIDFIAATHNCTIGKIDFVVHVVESEERGHDCATAISNYLNKIDGDDCDS